MKKTNLVRKLNSLGYTLLEVLVATAVLGILIVLASTIFINTVRNTNKAKITAEARENISLVAEILERDIRKAVEVTGGGNTIQVTDTSGQTINWACTAPNPPTANGSVTRQIGAGTIFPVTNRDLVEGVSITTCNFSINGTTANEYSITLDITAQEGVTAGSSSDLGVDVSHNITVTTRGF